MTDFHSLGIREVYKELNTSEKGLAFKEADKRIKRNGLNQLPAKKPLSSFNIFISQFNDPLIYILLFAGTISLILKDIIDASVIFGAVLLNGVIGYFQEKKANDSLRRLKQLVKQTALVHRESKEVVLNSSLLVVGDIIEIKAGRRVPADSRLIEAVNLQLNESSLTGESVPSTKSTATVEAGAPLADRTNMIYAGTIVVRGVGKAVITATGTDTEIGEIARLVKDTKEDPTPLQLRLEKFSRQLGVFFALICTLIFLVGISQGRGMFEMFILSVAIAVSSIPEGLGIAVTVTLAVGMQFILRKQALVRRLLAAETLGSTTVICTDKTGTLTEGKMHVSHIIIGQNEFEAKDPGSRQDNKEAKLVSLALQSAMMCNSAIVENPEDELAEWRIIGDPTDSALMSAAVQSGLDKDKLLAAEPRVDMLPFDSDLKYMISLHRANEKYVLYEKGAPERLLLKSSFYFHQGDKRQLTSVSRKKLEDNYRHLTEKGLRVIGVAMREFDVLDWEKGDDWKTIDNELTFIAFIALKDPLRAEARDTIEMSKAAGIRPVIITGDHQLTAKAIALEIGMKIEDENIITGDKLNKVSDDNMRDLVKRVDIYARVSPHHKLRIVKALQANKEVVAMTGDGINDSPALKAADIGISLGTGTDIAKETSDIVLLDNNFRTIVTAVKEGRVIFANIRKVVAFLISDSFSEMILVVGSIILGSVLTGLPIPLVPAQILWINIVNDGLPHFSLAFERSEQDELTNRPTGKNAPILNKEIKIIVFVVGVIRDFFIFAIFIYLYLHDFDINYIRTVIFAAMGANSLMYVFSLRSLKKPIWRMNPLGNPYMLMAVTASFALLFAGVYYPPLQKLLSTVPLDPQIWLTILSTGILTIILIELTKIYTNFTKK